MSFRNLPFYDGREASCPYIRLVTWIEVSKKFSNFLDADGIIILLDGGVDIMPDISLITSLYRSDEHLPQYIEWVQTIVLDLNLSLQIVAVVNDATETERHLIEDLAQSGMLDMKAVYCPRETLYASWNRGIAAADADVLGFWNVDDIRTAQGLTEGLRILNDGAEIVDFAFQIVQDGQMTDYPSAYRQDLFAPKTGTGPFFMFRRDLHQAAGDFNPHFRMVGDFEWSKRQAVREAQYVASDVVSGMFVLHGGNLTGGYNEREWVEFNIALITHEAYGHMRPVNPDLFETLLKEWGDDAPPVPARILQWLIGQEAEERYENYKSFRNMSRWQHRFQHMLERVGLRPTSYETFAPPQLG